MGEGSRRNHHRLHQELHAIQRHARGGAGSVLAVVYVGVRIVHEVSGRTGKSAGVEAVVNIQRVGIAGKAAHVPGRGYAADIEAVIDGGGINRLWCAGNGSYIIATNPSWFISNLNR